MSRIARVLRAARQVSALEAELLRLQEKLGRERETQRTVIRLRQEKEALAQELADARNNVWSQVQEGALDRARAAAAALQEQRAAAEEALQRHLTSIGEHVEDAYRCLAARLISLAAPRDACCSSRVHDHLSRMTRCRTCCRAAKRSRILRRLARQRCHSQSTRTLCCVSPPHPARSLCVHSLFSAKATRSCMRCIAESSAAVVRRSAARS